MNTSSLLLKKVGKILMICSNYDAFIMEEDGQIETQVYKEYIELGLTKPPGFVWSNSSAQARDILSRETDIDMIICMFNETDKGILPLASELRATGSSIPFVLLMHYSKETRHRLVSKGQEYSGIDFVFSWHGSADLILAIIKLFEDRMNADNDILSVGVQAILLVEDSIRYYSTYLPELYRLVLTQSGEFLKETLNEVQQKNCRRARPKILLATCYDEAVAIYQKYSSNILGIITDAGMVVHKGDDPTLEKPDAGIDFVNFVREQDPMMPVLIQSSQASIADRASELGVGFVRKYSRTLFIQLGDFIKEEFGFGDIVFRDSDGGECGRASSLFELEAVIDTIPDNVLLSKASRNMFSKWFYARGLFSLASVLRKSHHRNATQAREFIVSQIRSFHKAASRGIIVRYSPETYRDYITFARMGSGSLGGKARGIAFLNKLIDKYGIAERYNGISVSVPRTIVVTDEYFDRFITENGLQYVIDSDLSDDEILSEFVASRLPEPLVGQLRDYLKTVKRPLAVRSSSKLEDSNYQPFAGVYSTYMIPVTENKDQMLRMLDNAIKSVYASVYYNGSRSYIQGTGNLQSEEKMGVVVQDVCGSVHGGLFYPMLSGVARSINYYPIGREKAEDGIVNMVFGLGKTVVEGGQSLRFSPKFPKRILQLSQPELALRDGQKMMYAINLRPGAFKISRNEGVNFVHLPVAEAVAGYDYPQLVFSTYDESDCRIVPGTQVQGARVVTFDALLKYGKFPLAKALGEILELCREELSCEVEIEFAADIEDDSKGERLTLRLLQVRPISQHGEDSVMGLESNKSELSKVLVHSDKALGPSFIPGMKDIVIVPPEAFDSLNTGDIAAELAQVNSHLKEMGEQYLLIGPGRWGSADRSLGIPVSWSDISEAKVIVEYCMEGFQVEPSQGTHFFQNITSLGVGYLNVNLWTGEGGIETDSIQGLEKLYQGKYANVYRVPDTLVACIDRDTNRAVVGII